MGNINKGESGFGAVEGVLILVVVLVLAGAGWYVWHKNKNSTTAASNSVATTPTPTQSAKTSKVPYAKIGPKCTTADKTVNGELFTASNNLYSICIPDGWHILDQAYQIQTGYYWGSVFADAAGLGYKAGSNPVVDQTTEGKDGPFAFSFGEGDSSDGYYGQPLDADNWVKGSSIKAVNSTGVSYSVTATVNPGIGVGAIPKGTKEYTFSFNSSKKVLGLAANYNIFPGDKNQLDLIEKVLSTLKFN
jgi:hypothetical protein